MKRSINKKIFKLAMGVNAISVLIGAISFCFLAWIAISVINVAFSNLPTSEVKLATWNFFLFLVS